MLGIRDESTARALAALAGRRAADPCLATAYGPPAGTTLRPAPLVESEPSEPEAGPHGAEDAQALGRAGQVLWDQGRVLEAHALFARANQLKPDDPEILNRLGVTLWEQGRSDEAAACYRTALQIQPDSFDARMNLGVLLSDRRQLDEAMEWLQSAAQLRPDSPDILQNIGMTRARQGDWDAALDYYEQALGLRPDYAEVHVNRAFAWLYRGDYRRGWPELEWRLKRRLHQGFVVHRPLWRGEDLDGRFLLMHYEQALGDTLQFLRFAEPVQQWGGRVLMLCQPPLLRLAARCRGVDMAFDGTNPGQPDCHVHAPMMSLPAILGTTLETLPGRVPYLGVDPLLVEHWRSVLAGALARHEGRCGEGLAGSGVDRPAQPFLIGIVWQGSPTHPGDCWRSFPLAELAPLAELPGVRLVSLQVGYGLHQLSALGSRFPIIELSSRRPRDFLDTASIMTQLDLVIAPDSSVAHLAGGLGVRVWTALSTQAEWRWMADREDSPWYPSMRLFRQKTLGDWGAVFGRMTEALRRELALPGAAAGQVA